MSNNVTQPTFVFRQLNIDIEWRTSLWKIVAMRHSVAFVCDWQNHIPKIATTIAKSLGTDAIEPRVKAIQIHGIQLEFSWPANHIPLYIALLISLNGFWRSTVGSPHKTYCFQNDWLVTSLIGLITWLKSQGGHITAVICRTVQVWIALKRWKERRQHRL